MVLTGSTAAEELASSELSGASSLEPGRNFAIRFREAASCPSLAGAKSSGPSRACMAWVHGLGAAAPAEGCPEDLSSPGAEPGAPALGAGGVCV